MTYLVSPWLLVMIEIHVHVAGVYIDGAKADTIVETRGTSVCSYQIDEETKLLTNHTCFLDNQDFAVSVAADANEEVLFFSDIHSRKLFKYWRDQEPVQLLYGLGSVEGIAVDWLAKNLFWTDFELNHVCVSRYDGVDRAIIVSDDVLNPRGIVTEPFDGLIFWADFRGVSDEEGRIERSGMDGRGRFAIVEDDLVSPSGLVIDFQEKRLYFADRGTDKIESVRYDGQDRKLLYFENSADFFDTTIHGDVLFATVWRSMETDGSIMAIGYRGTSEGQVLQTLEHTGEALGITTLDRAQQPQRLNGVMGACGGLNGDCHHLCLPSGTFRRTCACRTGYRLADDGVSCETDYNDEHFFLVIDSSLNTIFQIDASTDSHDISALAIDDLDFPVALAYDHVDGMVYWTDRALSAIGRAKLNGTTKESVFIGNIHDPGGIALDTRRRLVYWTDEEKNEVGVSGMDSGARVFIDRDLDEPRAIAVNLVNGDVYWTDWGAVPKIERVSRDGTNRQALVDKELGWPNCLAIDSQNEVMYWCDALNDRIEMSNLDGGNRSTLVEFSSQVHPFSMAIYGDYVYWTDWLRHRLTRADRWTGEGVEEVGKEEFLRMQGLVAFESRDILEKVTDFATAHPTTHAPPPVNGALNLTVIIAAAGGGFALLLVFVAVVCCVVKCARSEGGRGPDDHVPMSVRSTSFVGSYDPSGLPSPFQANNNRPSRPSASNISDPIYEDVDENQKSEAAYEAYINPAYREGKDGEGGGGESS